MELEILASTYKPATVQALNKIREHLKSKIAKCHKEIDLTKSSLTQYEAVGEQFEEVVEKYAKIKGEVEGKKWALKELKETA